MLKVVVIIWVACLLGEGCATVSPEEAEYRRSIDRENWIMCQLALSGAGIMTIHDNHLHRGGKIVGLPENWAIKDDLTKNSCRQVLGDYWADY